MARTKDNVREAAAKLEGKVAAAVSAAPGAPPPDPVSSDGDASDGDADEPEYLVESIVKERVQRGKRQFLVSWVGFEEQTWEPLEHVNDTAAFEKWMAMAADDSEEEEEERRRKKKRQRKGGSSDEGEEYLEESSDSDSGSDGSWAPEAKRRESPGGGSSGGRGARSPAAAAKPAAAPLGGRQLEALNELLESQSEVGLRAALRGLVQEHPELLREARALLGDD